MTTPRSKHALRHFGDDLHRERCTVLLALAVRLIVLLCLFPLALPDHALSQTQDGRRQSRLEFQSSDADLVAAFDWAKQQAMAYVFTGDPVGPWYEAALPGRHAFCMRDVSHQAVGAQALGLERYTHNMLRRFTENISASKDWCSYWEIDRLNRPAPVDYTSDTDFWYNLPANFDVLDACYRMFLWTGNRTYIEDPVFENFYERTVTDYVRSWQLGADQIMSRKVTVSNSPHFHGDPSYEESRRDVRVGIDLLAAQYAGYLAFASMQTVRGDNSSAQTYFKKAAEVKELINTRWWNSSGNYFYSFIDQSNQFGGRAGADLLYFNATDKGEKTASALETLLATMKKEPESAVEPKSHYAEILYRYGRPTEAYAQIMDLTRPGRERREYPEVSYSVIGAIVTGLMGINVDTTDSLGGTTTGKRFESVVSTYPQLTGNTKWAELENVPVQGIVISVRHEAGRKTTLTNQGNLAFIWKAELPGSFSALMVDGKAMNAHSDSGYSGRRITWVNVTVPAGHTISVETPTS